MKKAIITAFLAAGFWATALAQTLTDSQVISIIQSEIKAGSSQSQIAQKLIQRGATLDQVQRLRDQYERTRSASVSSQTTSGERLEQSNVVSNTNQELTSASIQYNTDVTNSAGDEYEALEQNIRSNSGYNDDTSARTIFGHDVFRQRLLSFEPNSNLAVPQTYVLGPGDMVTIEIYGASQRTVRETVTRDGTITVPDYGPIVLSGMTVAQATETLKSQLGSRYVSSDIRLTVSQTKTIMVNVMGEVRAPGTYHLSSFATVFHALYMAGGINNLGTLRDVKVYRHGRLITSVDIYDFILNGKLTGNVRLQDEDLIQVGTYENLVGVTGNVKRPMFYEMKPTETVQTLIDYAGGFTGDAYKKTLRVVRKSGTDFSVFNVDEYDMGTFKLADGDAVTVDGILNRYSNMVEINGAVFRPGMYELGKDVFSVKSLINKAAGLTEDNFASHALIHRLKADRTLEVISVDVAGIMNGTKPDVTLKNEDAVFIPTQADRVQERTVTVTGLVMFPGSFQYADNMSVEDLIVQAGGLRDQASTARVDVSRRIIDPKATNTSHSIAQTFSFSLKDGLVVDGDKSFTLEPYDVVHVRRSPGYYAPRQITVRGEVAFEGQHTLDQKNMRLSDAIKMAGGLTQDAYVRGAQLRRTMNEEELRVRAALLESLGNTDEDDEVRRNRLETSTTYTVGIDLEEALANPGGDADLVLREGDNLFIPEYNGTVKVGGEVMLPNTLTFNSGKGYKWYVNQAGGFTKRARKRHAYIVYQNGTSQTVKKGAKVEPGSEIVIPSKEPREPAKWSDWVSLGTTMASMAALVASIIRLIN